MAAKMKNINELIAAGINPKTGLPIKMSGNLANIKGDIKRSLEILDRQNAYNRYTWYNLPNGLNGQLIERMLYYKGQLAMFYMESDENFYILPYALSGTIDVYGRFKGITPLPFNGTAQDEGKDGKPKAWITGLQKTPVYDMEKELDYDMFINSAVLLRDYSQGVSETIIPRQSIMEPILETMSEAFPMARTNLIANSGIKGMKVSDADTQANVTMASASIRDAALTGEPWIPILTALDIQDLTSAGSALKSEEFLLYMQSLDSYRLSLYGLKNGGLFQKKAHMLESEQDSNNGNIGLIYEDGLKIRQRFCDMVNYIWGLGIYCVESESVLDIDKNGDGMIGNKHDRSEAEIPNSNATMGGNSNDE